MRAAVLLMGTPAPDKIAVAHDERSYTKGSVALNASFASCPEWRTPELLFVAGPRRGVAASSVGTPTTAKTAKKEASAGVFIVEVGGVRSFHERRQIRQCF